MAATEGNPLLSTSKPSDSPLSVKLHPLVLLTITDHITRHSLTSKEGPVLGAVIGQQNGREVTMEHAFESLVKAKPHESGVETITMDEPWFGDRLAQYKEVHAAPQLDLVAAFTLGPTKGPLPEHVPLVQQLKATYNDDLILILFHPEAILDGSLTGGKLPISIYEAFYEPGTEQTDKGLQVDGLGIGRQLQLKFRQLPFEVETGEAEMIGVDYVAKGAANATLAVDASRKPSTATSSKGKEKVPVETNGDTEPVLSAEDEELIASLTSKSNAIKMLHARINLIKAYLASLPPSYLTDPSVPPGPPASPSEAPNHILLRQISALLSRLPLLAPPTTQPSTTPQDATRPSPAKRTLESDDVALVSLLASLTKTVADTRELTTKSSIVSRARNDKKMATMAREQREGGMGGGMDGPPELMMRGGRFGRGGRGGGGGYADGGEGGFDSGADGVDEY